MQLKGAPANTAGEMKWKGKTLNPPGELKWKGKPVNPPEKLEMKGIGNASRGAQPKEPSVPAVSQPSSGESVDGKAVVSAPKPRDFAPSEFGYKKDAKNPVPVSDANLAAAQKAMDKGLKDKALQQFNRIEADKALNVPAAQRNADTIPYLETMTGRDSPFAVFDDKNALDNRKAAAAYTREVEKYKAEKEKNIEKQLQSKLRGCNAKAEKFKADIPELKFMGSRIEEKKNQAAQNIKGAKKELDKLREDYKRRYEAALKNFTELSKLQQEIIDASGAKFTGEACFDAKKNNAGDELKRLSASAGYEEEPGQNEAAPAENTNKKSEANTQEPAAAAQQDNSTAPPAVPTADAVKKYYGDKTFNRLDKEAQKLKTLYQKTSSGKRRDMNTYAIAFDDFKGMISSFKGGPDVALRYYQGVISGASEEKKNQAAEKTSPALAGTGPVTEN